jgi:hypothetical protein
MGVLDTKRGVNSDEHEVTTEVSVCSLSLHSLSKVCTKCNAGVWICTNVSLSVRLVWSEFLATDPEVRVRFPALTHFLKSSGSVTGSAQPREYNLGATRKKK